MHATRGATPLTHQRKSFSPAVVTGVTPARKAAPKNRSYLLHAIRYSLWRTSIRRSLDCSRPSDTTKTRGSALPRSRQATGLRSKCSFVPIQAVSVSLPHDSPTQGIAYLDRTLETHQFHRPALVSVRGVHMPLCEHPFRCWSGSRSPGSNNLNSEPPLLPHDPHSRSVFRRLPPLVQLRLLPSH